MGENSSTVVLGSATLRLSGRLIARGEVRSYLSSQYLWAANHFSGLTLQIEEAQSVIPRFDVEHRAYSIGAVQSAVAFLEAAINELFLDAVDGHASYTSALEEKHVKALAGAWNDNTDRKSILKKYNLACRLSEVPPFDLGEDPAKSVGLLIHLRNALVHYKPGKSSSKPIAELTASLKEKFSENTLMYYPKDAPTEKAGKPLNKFFPDRCLGAGCTNWAVDSSHQFATEFFDRIGVTPNFMRVDFQIPERGR